MIVIDASMAGALVLPDEPDPPVAVQRRLYAGPLIAPAHWRLEAGNMVLMAVRRGRLSFAAQDEALAQLRALNVAIAPSGQGDTWAETFSLADLYRLTLYDAAYLDLALSRGAALASSDRDLIAAARACDVDLLTGQP